jgi:hypothetical protein
VRGKGEFLYFGRKITSREWGIATNYRGEEMKALRLIILILAFIALGFDLPFGPGGSAAQGKSEQEEAIQFLWAFGAIKRGEGEPKLIPIERDTALKSGDQIKFFLKLKEKCFVYLLYHSSQDELSVLFPYRFERLSGDYPTDAYYYVPQGDEWFEFDEHLGQETFYLLASPKRLHELEGLINQYETADPVKQPELRNKILIEIRKLRKAHRNFKTFAEKPVAIMGHMRGTEKVEADVTPDVTNLAIEICGKKFYSRTFTIDHQ